MIKGGKIFLAEQGILFPKYSFSFFNGGKLKE
jgi:hypothetical protein